MIRGVYKKVVELSNIFNMSPFVGNPETYLHSTADGGVQD
jgi:hypothetical protein